MKSPFDPLTYLNANSGAWTVLLSMAALIVSILAFRRSGPRVTVTLSSAMLASHDPRWNGRSAAVIDVTNDGARPIQIQSVYLISAAGAIGGETVGKISMPYSLQAYGGTQHWYIDRDKLRRIARSDGGEEVVEFRAIVQSGRRKYHSKTTESVHPLEPQKTASTRLPFRDRLRMRVRWWVKPAPQLMYISKINEVDVRNGRAHVFVYNAGGVVAHGLTLELMEQTTEGRRRLLPRISVPPVRRRKTVDVEVPLVDRPGLLWCLRVRGRARASQGAMTKSKAAEAISQAIENSDDAGPGRDGTL